MIGGVCAAFALHFGWELALTRIVAVLVVCLYPPAVIAYVAAWILIPQQVDFAAAPAQAVHPDLQPR
jgi:phage shock protein PspC (stress-responsive transcriptional regulator)